MCVCVLCLCVCMCMCVCVCVCDMRESERAESVGEREGGRKDGKGDRRVRVGVRGCISHVHVNVMPGCVVS